MNGIKWEKITRGLYIGIHKRNVFIVQYVKHLKSAKGTRIAMFNDGYAIRKLTIESVEDVNSHIEPGIPLTLSYAKKLCEGYKD